MDERPSFTVAECPAENVEAKLEDDPSKTELTLTVNSRRISCLFKADFCRGIVIKQWVEKIYVYILHFDFGHLKLHIL